MLNGGERETEIAGQTMGFEEELFYDVFLRFHCFGFLASTHTSSSANNDEKYRTTYDLPRCLITFFSFGKVSAMGLERRQALVKFTDLGKL